MLLFKRRYDFAAAHRLHSPALSEEENKAVFRQCNNPHGHGHNYEFEVFLTGSLNPTTQMMIDLLALDDLVKHHILDVVDHRYLDKEVALFQGVITTAENIAHIFFETLAPHFPDSVQLVGIRVYETRNNAALFLAPDYEALESSIPLIY